MLLESALANFSTHESGSHLDVRGWDWKPNSAPEEKRKGAGGGGVSNSATAAAAAAEIKHVYLDVKLLPGRQSSSELGSGPQKEVPLTDFLGMSSRSPPPPAVDAVSRADEKLSGAHPGGKPNSPYRLGKRSVIANSVADGENIPHDKMPFARDGKLKVQQQQQQQQQKRKGAVASTTAASTASTAQRVMHPPPNRVISMFKNGKGVSPTRSAPSPQRMEHSRGSLTPTAKGVSPIRQATRVARRNYQNLSVEAKPVNRTELSKTPPSPATVVHIDNSGNGTTTNSASKFYEEEESPVSILQRPLPSPPTTNSSASSGSSSVQSPPGAAVAAAPPPPPSQSLPGVTLRQHRRHLPSFSSSSAHDDSPRASTSSSNRYMGQCLVALQAALAIDPEKSKRFEDSFVELDTYVEGQQSANFPKSPIDAGDGFSARSEEQGGTLEWSTRGGRNAELEPEYNAMDFYSSSEQEDDEPRSRTASLTRSSSGSSSISKPIRRSLNYQPQVSADLYSSRDRRLLSSHPSSWVEQGGDDSVSSSNSNTLTRHHHYVPWDEQQADLDAVRAEEVVRGAIDGLRFTYSPVSSAFVFTRSTREGRERELEDDHDGRRGSASAAGYVSYRSPRYSRTFTDSETSRRFSGDYEAASACSEDSMSFARGSDVTELEVSRAESWSKVARAIAFQQGYQDAVPSSFNRRSGSHNNRGCSRRSNKPQSAVFQPVPAAGLPVDRGTPDSRLVRKSKKSNMTTCLPFRSILRNFRTVSAPGRSRLGMTPTGGDRQIQWSSSAPAPGSVSRLTY